MGGRTSRSVAFMRVNPVAFYDSQLSVNLICTAHSEARLVKISFTVNEHSTASLIAPQGNIIISAGDSSLATQDLLPSKCTEVTPHLVEAAAAPKGVKFIATNIRKIADLRAFFCFLSSAPISTKPKLLTHSSHGSVSIMFSDMPFSSAIFAPTARATIKRIGGAPYLGMHCLSPSIRYPQCGLTKGTSEFLERHSLRFPNGGVRHMTRAALVGVLRSILMDVGVPDMAAIT